MIHENSLKSYIEEKKKIGKRQINILQYIKRYRQVTAREIMIGLDLEDMNQVRPRLTELKQMNYIQELSKEKDLFTGKTVASYGVI